MKRKLRLKRWVKETLVFIAVMLVICGAMQIYAKRTEAINNGSFILVNDSEMDR